MKRLTCEVCGSTDIMKENGIFVCQACGCKYSLEEARKMMIEGTVEVTGTVRVNHADDIKNYLALAEKYNDDCNCKEALRYCDKVLELDPDNWKAWRIKSTANASRITGNFIDGSSFNHAFRNCPDSEKKFLVDEYECSFVYESKCRLEKDVFPKKDEDSELIALGRDLEFIWEYEERFAEMSHRGLSTKGKLELLEIVNNILGGAWAKYNIVLTCIYIMKAYEIGLLICRYDGSRDIADLKNSINQNLVELQDHIMKIIDEYFKLQVDFWNHEMSLKNLFDFDGKRKIKKRIDDQSRDREDAIEKMNRKKEQIDREVIAPLRKKCEEHHERLLAILNQNPEV